MQPLRILTSCLLPLPFENVDTDQIIPARYLKVTDKAGLVEGLFYEWRYNPDGSLRSDFPLNKLENQGLKILLAGDNFGCGSSREHAPWALIGWGLQAIISTSFADIFYNNSLKNGLLLVKVERDIHQRLFDYVYKKPEIPVTIDLEKQTLVTQEGQSVLFGIDPFSKICLLEGIDQLGYLIKQVDKIKAYEQRYEKV